MKLTVKSSTLAIGILVMLLGAIPAQAVTVDLEGVTAVRINNLEVDGVLYNVSFTAGTWPEAYGDQPPQLDVTPATAPLFAAEINEALTFSQARTVGEPGAAIDAGFYMIGTFWQEQTQFDLSFYGGFYADRFEDGAWLSEIEGEIFRGVLPGNTGSMWVNIAAVPIPAAVWLFGSGLLGLIGIARRKKTA